MHKEQVPGIQEYKEKAKREDREKRQDLKSEEEKGLLWTICISSVQTHILDKALKTNFPTLKPW